MCAWYCQMSQVTQGQGENCSIRSFELPGSYLTGLSHFPDPDGLELEFVRCTSLFSLALLATHNAGVGEDPLFLYDALVS